MLTATILEHLETIDQDHTDNLKIDTSLDGGKMRVWLARCGPKDGETQPIKIELFDGMRWSLAKDGSYMIDEGLHKGDMVVMRTGRRIETSDGYDVRMTGRGRGRPPGPKSVRRLRRNRARSMS